MSLVTELVRTLTREGFRNGPVRAQLCGLEDRLFVDRRAVRALIQQLSVLRKSVTTQSFHRRVLVEVSAFRLLHEVRPAEEQLDESEGGQELQGSALGLSFCVAPFCGP